MKMLYAIAAAAAFSLGACNQPQSVTDETSQDAAQAGEEIGEAAQASGEAIESATHDAAGAVERATDDNDSTQP